MPENLAGAVAKLPLVSDCIVYCKVGAAKEVNEGGVAGGIIDGVDALSPVPKFQLDMGAVLGEDRGPSAATSVSLVLRLLLRREVQLCYAGECILITQVLYGWGQFPGTIRSAIESDNVVKDETKYLRG